jgi:ParB-like chromosome segregation protein Spo0J
MPIEKLIPAPYNPRKNLKPEDKEYKKLKKSILEFDYIDPIIWNERTSRVVGGHQRLKILQEMGKTEIEVSVVDLPEEKEKALNLALNKNSGTWDNLKLKNLLEELDIGAFDIEITGFDKDEMNDIIKKQSPADIDELLKEYDMKETIENPIWVTIRTQPENREILEKALSILEQNGIRIERSYGI